MSMEASKTAIITGSLVVSTLIGALVAFLVYKYLTKDNKNPSNMKKWGSALGYGLLAMVVSGVIIYYIASAVTVPPAPKAIAIV